MRAGALRARSPLEDRAAKRNVPGGPGKRAGGHPGAPPLHGRRPASPPSGVLHHRAMHPGEEARRHGSPKSRNRLDSGAPSRLLDYANRSSRGKAQPVCRLCEDRARPCQPTMSAASPDPAELDLDGPSRTAAAEKPLSEAASGARQPRELSAEPRQRGRREGRRAERALAASHQPARAAPQIRTSCRYEETLYQIFQPEVQAHDPPVIRPVPSKRAKAGSSSCRRQGPASGSARIDSTR